MITIEAYFKGRDTAYAEALTFPIRRNAVKTVAAVNRLLALAGFEREEAVASGWRPPAVNDATQNAAAGSKHLTAEAVDVLDRERALARWCLDHQDKLEEVGLWMEDPRWTWSPNGNHWVHLQIVPPRSGRRVFIPNHMPPPGPYPPQFEAPQPERLA